MTGQLLGTLPFTAGKIKMPKLRLKNSFPSPLNLMTAVLCFSFAVALAKPAIAYLTDHKEIRAEFTTDFGFPMAWATTNHDNAELVDHTIGLDFLCEDVYVRAAGATLRLYTQISPEEVTSRVYGFPPLMAVVKLWILFLPTPKAMAVWALLVLLSVFLCSFYSLKLFRKFPSPGKSPYEYHSLVFLSFLFTFSYPSLFSFERGGNDITVLWLILAACYGFMKKRWWLVGASMMIAALLKIFPGVALAAVLFAAGTAIFGSFFEKDSTVKTTLRKNAFQVLVGAALAAVAAIFPLWEAYRYYFTKQIFLISKNLMKFFSTDTGINHSLKTAFGNQGYAIGGFLFFCGALALAFFVYGLWKSKKEDAILKYQSLFSLTYLSLLCVYLPNINSFDYNLILGIPFFCLVVFTPDSPQKKLITVASAVLLLGMTLPRWMSACFWPENGKRYSFFLVLQLAGLVPLAVSQLWMVFSNRRTGKQPA